MSDLHQHPSWGRRKWEGSGERGGQGVGDAWRRHGCPGTSSLQIRDSEPQAQGADNTPPVVCGV